MIQALLVDLDDTLLENDLGKFIPAYFDLLAGELAPFGPKDQILGALLAGTKAMLGNEDPERTLAQV
ncbi:MAG: DinB 2 protein [Anaerolineales bacterium]|nr:DinB 2 protein [Anaerolineales bacterium]